MSRTVSLLFGVHAHQPVGNFPEVMEEAFQRGYQPFLQTVYAYPTFRFALHASGGLLEWLLAEHPDAMALLREMVGRGQVELFGGGDMEPVLAAIPYRDRMSQLAALSDRLETYFLQRPQGAWLTERVWESTVLPALADAGLHYALVDDYHLLCAGIEPEALNGYYRTEEDGRLLDLYPISEVLRYRLPFSPAAEAVATIESLATEGGGAAAIYFDDIEKFGIWPETHHWVYEQQWLKQFIEGVLASPLIRSQHFADHHRENRGKGVVYLPSVSYSEMGAWSLPATAAQHYNALLEAAREAGRLDQDRRFLRGGIWKNFLSRYPEANWMHKRMLGLSARMAQLPAEQLRQDLLQLLHQAQANDAYWHGLFGGLYLPHLRRAVWTALLQLERRLDALQTRPNTVSGDLDLDGVDEVFMKSLSLQAVLRPDADAALIELSSYPLAQNFADTLKRYVESYHLQAGQDPAIAADELIADTRSRGLFVETFTDFEVKRPVAYASQVVQGDAVLCLGQAGETRVGKIYAVKDHSLHVALKIAGRGLLSTRLNLALPCGDGPAGRYVVNGEIAGGFGETLSWQALSAIRLEDLFLKAAVQLNCNPPANRIRARPHQTVSKNEAGFEKIMQAVELTLSWEVDGPSEIGLRLDVQAL